MQRTILHVLAGIVILSSGSRAQSYLPIEFMRAVKNNSRTTSGTPGENYFQNHADYRIEAEFDPSDAKLEGKARITYYNASRDTLRRLVFRLYHNVLKTGGIRDMELPPGVLTEGVHISALGINGKDQTQRIKTLLRTHATNMYLTLTEPLKPSSAVNIDISWETTLPPADVHRFGKYDKYSYFIAYWYPQVAVYDDINGWDEAIYNGTQEFYNDFNNYDVRISVPGSHMVWASGNWINPDEILSDDCLSKYREAAVRDEVIQVITPKDRAEKSWRRNKKRHTFHFLMDSIPDFAFAVSDEYIWDARSVAVDSAGNQRVLVSSVYPEGSYHFDRVADIGARALHHFSFSSYGLPYPYPGVTVFNGLGGMEYPMIVNNGESFFLNGTVFVTMHEIAHAYFPFLTGINERKYAWLDEGLTTYLPVETEEYLESDFFPISKIVRRYEQMAGSEEDVPLGISSYYTRDFAYFFQAYSRSATAFYMVENYLGRDNFRRGIREFIEVWQYKHPTPYDLIFILKKHSPKDPEWFIDQWFFQQGWPDIAIGSAETEGDTLKISLIQEGRLAVPVEIRIEYQEKEAEIIRLEADIWKDNEECLISHPLSGKPIRINLNDRPIPDADRSDNIYEITQN